MNTPSSAALQKRAEPQTGPRNQVRELEFRRRHCEERTRRSNPYFVRDGMDCFAEPVIGRAFARPLGSQ